LRKRKRRRRKRKRNAVVPLVHSARRASASVKETFSLKLVSVTK
jgi:hypothetical protein